MKALCIYVDAGKGHYIPAKAIAEEFEDMGVETRFVESFDYLDIKWLGKLNHKYWRAMLKRPKLERKLTKFADAGSDLMSVYVNLCIKHCWRMMKAQLEEFKPDIVMATHPYGSTALAEMFKVHGIKIPVYYYATDVFTVPVASICHNQRRLLVSTEEGAAKAVGFGLDRSEVAIVPFPLQRSLSQGVRLSKREAREKLGLPVDLFTMQLNLGGEGLGSLSLLESLLKQHRPMQIIILGGINKEMRAKIDAITKAEHNRSVLVHTPGFVTNVNEYLLASDIIAGRAGINTILEAMYDHRPFLVTDVVYTVIPSADYIVKYKVGWNAAEDKKLQAEIVEDLIDHPEKLDEMDKAFDDIPIDFSARAVAEYLVDDARAYFEEIGEPIQD